MIKLRWPIVIEKKRKTIQTVDCFHCGRQFFVVVENLRAANFCSQCR
jgi:hypothetical protein